MIKRLEEIERRLRALWDALRAFALRLQAVDDRVNQIAAGAGGVFGSSNCAIGRAVGAIPARSGTTVGGGYFHFAEVVGTTLTEGADPTAQCVNILDQEIADDAWLVLVKEPKWWVVIAAGSCGDLS